MSDKLCNALTPKQNIFVDEYLVDLNATQAAIRAGYSAKTGNEQGARLLANVSIQEALSNRMQDRQMRTEITQDRVLQEYAKIAFFDPRKLFDAEGKLIHIANLDPDTAAAISGVDVQSINNEPGLGEIRKYKPVDKKGALDSLARHLGMFNDKMFIQSNVRELTDDQLNEEIALLAAKLQIKL